jgi:low affinity Fe/Cu permease
MAGWMQPPRPDFDMNAHDRRSLGKSLSSAVQAAVDWASSIHTTVVVVFTVVGLFVAGIVTGFSHSWQVVVHSTGALVSVLMVFVIQHTANQHTSAILLKLDELIHTSADARNAAMDAENRDIGEQDDLREDLDHGV